MSEQRLPTEIPRDWMPGQQLYQRQRSFFEPLWSELDEQQRETWANVERYVAFRERQHADPNAVVVEPETAIEWHERHIEAIEAVLKRSFPYLRADTLATMAEELLAAADTGI